MSPAPHKSPPNSNSKFLLPIPHQQRHCRQVTKKGQATRSASCSELGISIGPGAFAHHQGKRSRKPGGSQIMRSSSCRSYTASVPTGLSSGKEPIQEAMERLPSSSNLQPSGLEQSSSPECQVPLIEKALGASGLSLMKVPSVPRTHICPQASRPWRAGSGQRGLAVPVRRSLDRDVVISESTFFLFLGQRMQGGDQAGSCTQSWVESQSGSLPGQLRNVPISWIG